jgi:hypothetical protein
MLYVKVKILVDMDASSYMDVLVKMARKYGKNFREKGLTIGLVLAGQGD